MPTASPTQNRMTAAGQPGEGSSPATTSPDTKRTLLASEPSTMMLDHFARPTRSLNMPSSVVKRFNNCAIPR